MSADTAFTKMKLEAVDTKSKAKPFIVQINPSSISSNIELEFDNEQPGDSTASQQAFIKTRPETLKFDFILDGTGVIRDKDNKVIVVKDEIEKLRELSVAYDGEQHQPNALLLTYGDIMLEGKVKSLDVTYQLFNSQGKVLRAKVALGFTSSKEKKEEEKEKNKKSPDMTHIVTVQVGDTLPNLCQRIYGKTEPVLEVAKKNNLINFRNLKPGMEVIFPPIV